MALQTREQHIAAKGDVEHLHLQVLLAVMASMYAVYHGPAGLKAIASRVHLLAKSLAGGLKKLGLRPSTTSSSTPSVFSWPRQRRPMSSSPTPSPKG